MLVHPTFYDPCSLVVLEALACGLPVITSAHNGASERMTPPQEGFVVADPNEQQRLADCLVQLLDSDQRAKCSLAARRAARGWTMDDHVKAIEQICRAVADRKRRAAA
jgi:UDP-glucose:(heptosyl)LPS alpha-1,3-glucosyltransferase